LMFHSRMFAYALSFTTPPLISLMPVASEVMELPFISFFPVAADSIAGAFSLTDAVPSI
jgi:hypothetical protein